MRWPERLLVGVMFALAFFAFESGVAHIALGRDAACQASLASARVAPGPGSGCLSDLASATTRALAFGPGSVVLLGTMTLGTWLVSVGAYAAIGGACAQLSPGQGVLAFLGVHAILVMALSFALHIGPHMVR